MISLALTVYEGTCLATTRLMLGDERTAELLFAQDPDHGFIMRHPHQLSSLFETHFMPDEGPEVEVAT